LEGPELEEPELEEQKSDENMALEMELFEIMMASREEEVKKEVELNIRDAIEEP